jgi:hypothetical protein
MGIFVLHEQNKGVACYFLAPINFLEVTYMINSSSHVETKKNTSLVVVLLRQSFAW